MIEAQYLKRIEELEYNLIKLEAKVADICRDLGKRVVRPRKPTGKARFEGFDPSVLEAVNKLWEIWPKTRIDGTKVANDKVDACSNITKILQNAEVSIDDLIASAAEWVASAPTYPNAIQFYFGVGSKESMPRWERELRGYLTRGKNEV